MDSVMIPIIRPYGSINRKIIKGIAKSKLYKDIYYVVDIDYNFFRITYDTYLSLFGKYPVIELKRKGV